METRGRDFTHMWGFRDKYDSRRTIAELFTIHRRQIRNQELRGIPGFISIGHA